MYRDFPVRASARPDFLPMNLRLFNRTKIILPFFLPEKKNVERSFAMKQRIFEEQYGDETIEKTHVMILCSPIIIREAIRAKCVNNARYLISSMRKRFMGSQTISIESRAVSMPRIE